MNLNFKIISNNQIHKVKKYHKMSFNFKQLIIYNKYQIHKVKNYHKMSFNFNRILKVLNNLI